MTMLVAVVGGGQLGRMLALAGHRLGLRFRFLDPDPQAPAGQVAELVVGAYDDPAALRRLVRGATAATYEFENVPPAAAQWLEAHAGDGYQGVFPSSRSLQVGQDRVAEKEFLRSAGLDLAPFAPVDDETSLAAAVEAVGLPAILKTRRLGYDGKGQARVREASEAVGAWRQLGSVPCCLERFVPFEREVSVLAVRGRDGQVAAYPLVENVHDGGLLRLSSVASAHERTGWSADAEELARRAVAHAVRVLEALDHVGVLCIEFFVHEGRLLANEMAPRVHNSGHWTIEGAVTSQFENHLRAVLGLPLGGAAARGAAAMVNLVGWWPPLERLLEIDGACVHLYGKTPRPGRKVGHVTMVAPDAASLKPIVDAVCELAYSERRVPEAGAGSASGGALASPSSAPAS